MNISRSGYPDNQKPMAHDKHPVKLTRFGRVALGVSITALAGLGVYFLPNIYGKIHPAPEWNGGTQSVTAEPGDGIDHLIAEYVNDYENFPTDAERALVEEHNPDLPASGPMVGQEVLLPYWFGTPPDNLDTK